MKVFPFSVGSNGLSCYKTGFHQIRYALNVCYLCVRLQAALIHFDGAVLFTDILTYLISRKLVMSSWELRCCVQSSEQDIRACMQRNRASSSCIIK